MTDRRKLDDRRLGVTFDLQHGGQNNTYQVTVGFHRDRSVGEVFISGAKVGSQSDALARDGAVLISLALQHGVPLDTIRHAVTREADGSPSTIIGAVIDGLEGIKL